MTRTAAVRSPTSKRRTDEMSTGSQVVPRWSEWHEIGAVVRYPQHLRRTIAVALCVGSVFFAMNQLAIVLAGGATPLTWLKVSLTYLTPFCMSNFGILTATYKPREGHVPNTW
jgi:hypothetical protein